jgi:hypothetical protein
MVSLFDGTYAMQRLPKPIHGRWLSLGVTALGVLVSARSVAQQPAVDFARDVQPLLAKNCYACHGASKAEGGLRFTSRDAALAVTDSGLRAIVPGQPEHSELLRRIASSDESLRMPPEGSPLTERQVDQLRRWVVDGAQWQAHWAFQPVASQTPPAVADAAWGRNPIDAFVLQRLEQNGLRPAPPASKVALLRRAYYDLIGLPPKPEEVDAFLADKSPQAFEQVLDRLLQSPQYGERWARHWLDLVRFAETNSYERDSVKPHAWRYRDYVIQSLNDDKPYDQFLREQLAGDELPAPAADAVIATGFYRLGIWDDEPADRQLALFDALDDIVTATGQVFLGLTVNCSRCHDHKIDPITQQDYYSLLAFFHNISPMANSGPNVERKVTLANGQEATVLCVSERGPKAPETFVLARGNPASRGQRVELAFPSILDPPRPLIAEAPAGAASSGRRLVLANWLAAPDNRLTARVMVNRIWQHHFGRGIVRSPNNFGLGGIPPTHPELLDWLAAEFIRNGWRLKAMHRLVMLSNTYQMSAQADEDALARDAENDWFSRFDIRRLSAEEIRDSIQAVSGRLNGKMFGPGVYPEISPEVLAGQSRPGSGWGQSPPDEQARRSIYIHVKRSLLTPLLTTFDLADPDSSCEARFVTTQPAQALAMLNGQFLNDQAAAWAERLRREAGDQPASQVRLALRLALCREPDGASVRHGLQLLSALQEKHGVSGDKALDYYCLLVFNLNEFLYVD